MAIKHNRDIVKVATMYYKKNLKQSEIAKHLGISRSLVSKYLNDAKNEGIVDIFIKSESAYSIELELALEEAFGLKKAAVLDTSSLRKDEIERLLVQTAITAFQREIAKAQTIGLSWGKMLRGIVDEYPYENHADATIIPLIGGLGSELVDVHSNQLAYDLAKKLRAKCKYLYAPALVDNAFIKKSLIENEGIRDVLDAGRNVDFALVGIASPFSKNNTMTEIGYVDQQDIDELEKLSVIGDVNSKFIDQNGQEVACEINENVIGLSVGDVRKISNVAVACYEESKKEVLYVGTKTKIFTHVTVTDSLAEYLLEQAKNEAQ